MVDDRDRGNLADGMGGVDPATMRRILVHEARVHATPGRRLRDLGDSLLLHDPLDPEPFWNRLEAVRWPVDARAFDRRLDETMVLFASLGRRPHIWASPAFDEPADLVGRLLAAGFEDVGPGMLMRLEDAAMPGRLVAGSMPTDPSVELVRWNGLTGSAADAAAQEIVEVLVDAFSVEPDRSGPIRAETVASLGHSWFTHYLVRWRGQPAAAARRATFDGLTYLSSIGTARAAQGRGFAGLVTAAAAHDAVRAGSEHITLGVFAENETAIRLYQRTGFRTLGRSAADLLLVG
jgi:ribosomal protein S18 acetylase RimI-like enzyme